MPPCVLSYRANSSWIIGLPSTNNPTKDGIAINILVFNVSFIFLRTAPISPCVYDATILGNIEADIAEATPCGIPDLMITDR